MKFRDTSKIVTFYSKEYGKLKGIAKGARTAKNKFGSSFEPMTRSMLVIYKKEHQDIHLISQCDAIESYRNLTDDLDRMANALAVLELVNQVTHHEEKNPALFDLLVNTMEALNSSNKNYSNFLQAFRLRLAGLFGYAPNIDVCGTCGKVIEMNSGEKQFAFQTARGAILCNRCYAPADKSNISDAQYTIFTYCSAPALQILRRLLTAQMSSLSNIEFDENIGNEIDDILRLYLRCHFDGLKPSKAKEILQQFNITM
jgi:DNA repair protein RecO (recombination protein O)